MEFEVKNTVLEKPAIAWVAVDYETDGLLVTTLGTSEKYPTISASARTIHFADRSTFTVTLPDESEEEVWDVRVSPGRYTLHITFILVGKRDRMVWDHATGSHGGGA